jgi:hypothetical protein
VALLFVALLAFGDLAVFARQPKPTPAAGQEAQDDRMINWTRWWRQLRYTLIRC